ncbi:MAG: endonuclease domain-containing protein [Methylomicrobium sp.]
MTDAEKMLWPRVRRKQILSVPFYRQKPIDEYIVDFYAPQANLVIELDGGQHLETKQQRYDQQRTLYLQKQGLAVLRFTNLDVLKNIEGVMKVIFREVRKGLERF